MLPALSPPGPAYVLGHSDAELERLIAQGRWFGEQTAELLRQAGLRPGMRVLDAGCGAGDVALLAASMVGPDGLVVGVDRAPDALALAERRAAAAGLPHVRFVSGDLATLKLAEQPEFDAVIGRLVLMYSSDPAVVVRHLATFLRPGGIVAFHEFDLNVAASEPRCDLFETAVGWVKRGFQHVGVDARVGLKLSRVYREAGLPAPRMHLTARLDSGSDWPIYAQLTQIVERLAPVLERAGIASHAEMQLGTLAERLRAEAQALGATLVAPALVGAWTRTAAGNEEERR
jgi:SAM-dependent methyltransferase